MPVADRIARVDRGSPEAKAEEIIPANERELNKVTLLKTPPPVMAVFYRPEYKVEDIKLEEHLSLVLDGIQDPGNVGTIVRWPTGLVLSTCFALRTARIYLIRKQCRPPWEPSPG